MSSGAKVGLGFLNEEASHWVQHEEADQVNKLIGTFLQAEK